MAGSSVVKKLFNGGALWLYETLTNGTNKVKIQAPATLASDYTLTLPSDDGSSNQVLKTDGSGGLSWATVATTLDTAYDGGRTITADAGAVAVSGAGGISVSGGGGLAITDAGGISVGSGGLQVTTSGTIASNGNITTDGKVDATGNLETSGDVVIDTGSYSAGRIIMGSYYIWVDTDGELRIKSGVPSTEGDGKCVGYKFGVDGWARNDIPTSTSIEGMDRSSGPFIPLKAGSVTGLAIRSSEARAAGTCTVTLYKNGSTTGMTVALNGTGDPQWKVTSSAIGGYTFVSGDLLSLYVATDGSWSPDGTADIKGSMELTYTE